MNTRATRVALIDEDRLMIDLLADYLRRASGFALQWTATNTKSGLKLLRQNKPDVVVADVLGDSRGIFDIIDSLARRRVSVSFVILTRCTSHIVINEALRLRVAGFLLKTDPLEEFINGLERIARGEISYARQLDKQMRRDTSRKQFYIDGPQNVASLTGRQLEVLRFIAMGKTTKEVAAAMHILPKSVENHRYRIMQKLGIHNSVELTRYSIREGLTSA